MSEARVEQQARRIRELLERVEELQDRLERIEASLIETLEPRYVADLTRSEQLLVALLMRRERVRREELHSFLYSDRPADDEEAEMKIVDVFICKIRKKLKPFGVEIQTIYGEGFCLPRASKEILAKGAAA